MSKMDEELLVYSDLERLRSEAAEKRELLEQEHLTLGTRRIVALQNAEQVKAFSVSTFMDGTNDLPFCTDCVDSRQGLIILGPFQRVVHQFEIKWICKKSLQFYLQMKSSFQSLSKQLMENETATQVKNNVGFLGRSRNLRYHHFLALLDVIESVKFNHFFPVKQS